MTKSCVSCFSAQRYASVVYAIVCPSVCPSQAGIVSQRLDLNCDAFGVEASVHLSYTLL